LSYLEGKEKRDVVWMHYPDNDIYIPDLNEVSHVLKVVGNPMDRILYAFVRSLLN
jgi:hypothetical protein